MSDPIVDILKEIVARVDNHTEFTELYYERIANQIRAKLAKPDGITSLSLPSNAYDKYYTPPDKPDEKLREKISVIAGIVGREDATHLEHRELSLKKAKQIQALLPDVRREERERIANIIKEYRLDSASVRDDMLELKAMGWELLEQALKVE